MAHLGEYCSSSEKKQGAEQILECCPINLIHAVARIVVKK
jgi:hypothetical protein